MTALPPWPEHALAPNELRLSAVVLRLYISPTRLFDLAGVTARAVVLGLIARGDPALAEALRRPAAARPYTVALLHGERLTSTLAVRVTAVGAAIPRALAAGAAAQAGRPPLTVGRGQVEGVRIDTDPACTAWAGAGRPTTWATR